MTKAQLQPGTPGRNDACPCGSQKKYKKCCGGANAAPPASTPLVANPNQVALLWQIAVQGFERGQLALAQASCEQVFALAPQHADALQLRAMIALRQQDYATALEYIQQAIQQAPHNSIFYNSLGTIQQGLGQVAEAEQAYRQALELEANSAMAWHNLGDCCHAQERIEEALQCYREALRCQPDFPEAHNNLGLLLLSQQQLESAVAHLVQAIELRPDYLKAHYSLSRALREQGRAADAQRVLERATQLDPTYAEAWHDLGLCLQAQEKPLEAIAMMEKAVQLQPQLHLGYLNIGNIYYERGLVDVALQYFARAQAVRPTAALQVKMALCLPAIYDSAAHVQAERARLASDIDRLLASDIRLKNPHEEVALTPFYLAYQGENEVEILSRTGDLFLKACPSLGEVAPHCQTPKRQGGPLKIGFISSSFVRQNHIVNRVMSGVLTNWPRDTFQLTVLHRNMPCGQIVQALRNGDRLISIPNALDAARQKIAAEELDILFYCDLGMEPWTYFLAFSRLARIQLTCGGHPITSGIPNVDYFLSSAIDEVPHAQAHYREQLILPPQRSVCYLPANTPPQNKTRADFGLPENKRLYLCPMTPYKLHPDNDQLFGEILRADPEGEIVFVVNYQTELWDRLKQRFARTIPDVAARLRFLPFLLFPDFIELLRRVDVVLDTIKFNGGTTSLEALAVGTPIVTWPGELLRERCTYSMYNAMGFYDCVVQNQTDYVRLATEIARRPDYRAHLQEQILARNAVLYGQTDWIQPFSQFLLEAMENSSLERS